MNLLDVFVLGGFGAGMFAQQEAPSSEGTGGRQLVDKMLGTKLGLYLLPHRSADFQSLEL